MRQDQFERLQQLHEDLVDVFLDEADPKKWPGQGIELVSMDQQTRGDRYWSKKNAVATIALTQRIQSLVEVVRKATSNDEPDPSAVVEPEADLDRQVADAERDANALLRKLQDPKEKAHFDRKVHGKA